MHNRSAGRVRTPSRASSSMRPDDTRAMFRMTVKRFGLPASLTSEQPRSIESMQKSGEPGAVRTRRSSAPPSASTTTSQVRPGVCLLETPYCKIDCDAEHALARFVRTGLPYARIEDIDRDGVAVERALDGAGNIRLLVDLRAVAPRDDPDFEAAIVGFRRKLVSGKERVAILVQTAVGALQVKRHMREDGFQVGVFVQEEEAIAFLLNPPVNDRLPVERSRPAHFAKLDPFHVYRTLVVPPHGRSSGSKPPTGPVS